MDPEVDARHQRRQLRTDSCKPTACNVQGTCASAQSRATRTPSGPLYRLKSFLPCALPHEARSRHSAVCRLSLIPIPLAPTTS
eukprot:6516-Eustigmatos_ZCMA.PRE.1